jgi:transposase
LIVFRYDLLSLLQLPKCSAYPGPLSVLVMDNAKIHHGQEILELVDRFGECDLCYFSRLCFYSFFIGVRVEYLPPYSPDLNPIEEAFSKIKHWVRRYQDDYGATQGDGILYDMLEVLEIITSEDAEEYFIHAGYF